MCHFPLCDSSACMPVGDFYICFKKLNSLPTLKSFKVNCELRYVYNWHSCHWAVLTRGTALSLKNNGMSLQNCVGDVRHISMSTTLWEDKDAIMPVPVSLVPPTGHLISIPSVEYRVLRQLWKPSGSDVWDSVMLSPWITTWSWFIITLAYWNHLPALCKL